MRNVIIFAMTEKGHHVLNHILHDWKHLIEFVVVARDTQMQTDYSDEITKVCEDHGIDYFQRGSEPEINPTHFVLAISWRWLINHPSHRLIIFHDSLLPKYRGFAPLVNMLIKGETEIGVSAILGGEQYDTGNIIFQESSSISYPIKILDAIKINNIIYSKLFGCVLQQIQDGTLPKGTPQNADEATYSIWRDFEDYYIDWNNDAAAINRHIDALGYPYAGARARTSTGDEVVITDAQIVPDKTCEFRHVGKVLSVDDGMPTVICGTGLLKITRASIVTSAGLAEFLPMKCFRVRFT